MAVGAIDALPALLPLAAGVALSPFPVVASVLVLSGPRGRPAGLAFAAGWLAGLGALTAAAMLLIGGLDGEGGTPAALLRLALGAALLVAAVRKWRGRPRAGETPPPPGWITALHDVAPGRAALVGAGLGGLNPKNIAFAAAAASSIGALGLDRGPAARAGLLFVALGSASVLAALAVRLAGGRRADGWLDSVRGFMIQNAAVILMVVFVVLGVGLIGEGLAGLTG